MNSTIIDSTKLAKLKRKVLKLNELEKNILPFGDCSKELFKIVKLQKKINQLILEL
jgi:hypothetical protein